MQVEIRSQGNNNLIHEFTKGLEVLPRANEIIIIQAKKMQVVNLDHYLNESKIVIRCTKF